MNEELAYTVYQIDQNIGLVSELMEKDKEYTKEGKLNCLESLKAKLVIPGMYVGAAEPQLREN
jgi:hypothetical protein